MHIQMLRRHTVFNGGVNTNQIGPAYRRTDASDADWLLLTLAPISTRRIVSAQRPLFADGEVARGYYLVISGELIVVRQRGRVNPAVHFMTAGSLFIHDCDGVHMANCHAVVDSVVLHVERRRLERLAHLDPVLMRVLHAVHAGELEMILQTLGAERGCRRVDERPRKPLRHHLSLSAPASAPAAAGTGALVTKSRGLACFTRRCRGRRHLTIVDAQDHSRA